MSVMSDKWIRSKCTMPTHRHHYREGTVTRIIGPPYTDQQQRAINNWCDERLSEHYVHLEYAVPLKEEDLAHWKPMIEPFVAESVKTIENEKGLHRILSYGVSSYGYDIRLAPENIKVFTNLNSMIVDPRKVDEKCYTAPELRTDEDGLMYVLQPPNSIMLGHTVEYFCIPNNVLANCIGKSTYARVGVSLIVTPLEPGWEGNLVVEIVNHTNSPVKIYPHQGIGQLVFMEGNEPCDVSYADRAGKYQGQTGTTDAMV